MENVLDKKQQQQETIFHLMLVFISHSATHSPSHCGMHGILVRILGLAGQLIRQHKV